MTTTAAPTTCKDCGRQVETDPVNGRPAADRGYCLGTTTCLQRPGMATGWKIDRDHIAEQENDGRWTPRPRVGVGAINGGPIQHGLQSVALERPIAFRLKDDDGETYYSGAMSLDFLNSERCFEPLDFAANDAGATTLEYREGPAWKVL